MRIIACIAAAAAISCSVGDVAATPVGDVRRTLALTELLELGRAPPTEHRYVDCLAAQHLASAWSAQRTQMTDAVAWLATLGSDTANLGKVFSDLPKATRNGAPSLSADEIERFFPAQCQVPVDTCHFSSVTRPGGSPAAWLGGEVRRAATSVGPWLAARLLDRPIQCSDEATCAEDFKAAVCVARDQREWFLSAFTVLERAVESGALADATLRQALAQAREIVPELAPVDTNVPKVTLTSDALAAAAARLLPHTRWPDPNELATLAARFGTLTGEAVGQLRKHIADAAREAVADVPRTLSGALAPVLPPPLTGDLILKGSSVCLLAMPLAGLQGVQLAVAAPLPPRATWADGEDCATSPERVAIPIGLTLPRVFKDSQGRWQFPNQVPIAGGIEQFVVRALLIQSGLPPWLRVENIAAAQLLVVNGGRGLEVRLRFELALPAGFGMLREFDVRTPVTLEFSRTAADVRAQLHAAVRDLEETARERVGQLRIAVPKFDPLLVVDQLRIEGEVSTWLQQPPRIRGRLMVLNTNAAVTIGVAAKDGALHFAFESQDLTAALHNAVRRIVVEKLRPLLADVAALAAQQRAKLEDLGVSDLQLKPDGTISAVVRLNIPAWNNSAPPALTVTFLDGQLASDAEGLMRAWVDSAVARIKLQAEAEVQAALNRQVCEIQAEALNKAQALLPSGVVMMPVAGEPANCPAAVEVRGPSGRGWDVGVSPIRLGLAGQSRTLDFRDARLYRAAADRTQWRELDADQEFKELIGDSGYLRIEAPRTSADAIRLAASLVNLPVVGTVPVGDIVIADGLTFECSGAAVVAAINQRIGADGGRALADSLQSIGGAVKNPSVTSAPVCGSNVLALTATVALSEDIELPAKITLLPNMKIEIDKEGLESRIGSKVLGAIAGLGGPQTPVSFGEPTLSPLSVPFTVRAEFLTAKVVLNGIYTSSGVRIAYPLIVGLGIERVPGSAVALPPIDFARPALILNLASGQPAIGLQASIVIAGTPPETFRFDASAVVKKIDPLQIEFQGDAILLGSFNMMHAEGVLNTKPLEATFSAVAKDPLGLLVLEQGGRFDLGKIEVGGSMTALSTRVGEARAVVMIEHGDVIVDMIGRATLPIGEAEASFHSRNVVGDLRFGANVEALKIGSWVVGGIDLKAESSWAKAGFTVLGVRLGVSTQSVRQITPDLILEQILAMFEFNLEELLAALQDPNFELGSPIGGGDGGSTGDGGDHGGDSGGSGSGTGTAPVAAANGGPSVGQPGTAEPSPDPGAPSPGQIEQRAEGPAASPYEGAPSTNGQLTEQASAPGPCFVRFEPVGASCVAKLEWCGQTSVTVIGPYSRDVQSALVGSTLLASGARRTAFDLGQADERLDGSVPTAALNITIPVSAGGRTRSLVVSYATASDFSTSPTGFSDDDRGRAARALWQTQLRRAAPIEVVAKEDGSLTAIRAQPMHACDAVDATGTTAAVQLPFKLPALVPGLTPAAYRAGSATLAAADVAMLQTVAAELLGGTAPDELRVLRVPALRDGEVETTAYMRRDMNAEGKSVWVIAARTAYGTVSLPTGGAVEAWLLAAARPLGMEPEPLATGPADWRHVLVAAIREPPISLTVWPETEAPRLIATSGLTIDRGETVHACQGERCMPWALAGRGWREWDAAALLADSLAALDACGDEARWVSLVSVPTEDVNMPQREIALIAPNGSAGSTLHVLAPPGTVGPIATSRVAFPDLRATWGPHSKRCGALDAVSDWRTAAARVAGKAPAAPNCPSLWFVVRGMATTPTFAAATCP